ncbi:MAG: hypothetical protein LBB54_02445 [Cellulomonadaceae bacterium]|jgi:hypothetical protein|nr:hypothetical protein [Cellulomonadaceae bacterium]
MKSDWIKPLIGKPGPFATVFLDATPSGKAGDQDVAHRWRVVRRSLAQQGAPDAILDTLEDAALQPTRKAGAHGRVLIADADGIHVDKALRARPVTPVGLWNPLPALVQAALAAQDEVHGIRVGVDSTGADVLLAGPHGWGQARSIDAPHDDDGTVDPIGPSRGGRRGGGNSGDRGDGSHGRSEDTHLHNAEAIARELDHIAAADRPEVIFLWGEARMVAAVRSAVGSAAAGLVVEVPGGHRGVDVPAGPFRDRFDEAIVAFRAARTGAVLEDFQAARGHNRAVSGIDDVVAVLNRGQVAELVLDAGIGLEPVFTSADESQVKALRETLWTGVDPIAISADPGALPDASGRLEKLPAAIALVRSAVGQDAGLTFAPEGAVDLYDGVGAILRWTDDATPADSAASMLR